MISDSIPWKEELLRVASVLEGRRTQQRWTERTSFLVERDVMIAAYAIRRLIEASKVSDDLAETRINVLRHRLTGKPVDIRTRSEFYEHYDMESPESVELSLVKFCNQIIHSWVWMLSATEEKPHRFDGIYVSSDYASKRFVYFVSTESFVKLLQAIGREDIQSVSWRQDVDGWHVDRVEAHPESNEQA